MMKIININGKNESMLFDRDMISIAYEIPEYSIIGTIMGNDFSIEFQESDQFFSGSISQNEGKYDVITLEDGIQFVGKYNVMMGNIVTYLLNRYVIQ